MPVTQQTYQAIALEDPEGQWELHRGRLREKPSMSWGHNDVMMRVGFDLNRQLNPSQFYVRINSGRVRSQDETYYIPDVSVIPISYRDHLRGQSNALEVYDRPLPLVIEVWSPSTGGYDVDSKLPEYQRRGDLEIWRLHPVDRTLTIWRRGNDGSYSESVVTSGSVRPIALPGVTIELNALFAVP